MPGLRITQSLKRLKNPEDFGYYLMEEPRLNEALKKIAEHYQQKDLLPEVEKLKYDKATKSSKDRMFDAITKNPITVKRPEVKSFSF